jgi:hypothetical protein
VGGAAGGAVMTPIRVPLSRSGRWLAVIFGQEPNPTSVAITVVLMAVGAAAVGSCALAWHRAHTAAGSISHGPPVQSIASQRRVTASSPSRANLAGVDPQTEQVGAMIRRLNYPWPAVLDELEQWVPENISIVELALDAQQQQARLRVSATHVRDVTDWVEQMKGARNWIGLRVLEYSNDAADPSGRAQIVLQGQLLASESPGEPSGRPMGGTR